MYICKIYWPTNHIIIVSALTVAVTVGSRPNFALTDWRSRSLARENKSPGKKLVALHSSVEKRSAHERSTSRSSS